MARKIKALVLRSIRTAEQGIVRKGGTAFLTSAEFSSYADIDAVERIADEKPKTKRKPKIKLEPEPRLEGDDV